MDEAIAKYIEDSKRIEWNYWVSSEAKEFGFIKLSDGRKAQV